MTVVILIELERTTLSPIMCSKCFSLFLFFHTCIGWFSYAKAYDPDNWFIIDEETAEIKLTKAPDRESPFLVNGTYIAEIVALTKGNY